MPGLSVLMRRARGGEGPLVQEQETNLQEPAPLAAKEQALEGLPPEGSEAPPNLEPLIQEPEVEQQETLEQEPETEQQENLEQEPEMEQLETPKQEEGAEPADDLLAIFQQEAVPDMEALSLVEGLVDIDVDDLVQESRDLAKRRGGEKPR